MNFTQSRSRYQTGEYFTRETLLKVVTQPISAIRHSPPVLKLKYWESYGTASLQSRRQSPFQSMPPCRRSTSWPWITPENTATLATLSPAYSFSHSPRKTGRGGGSSLLISPLWSHQVLTLDHLPTSAFEFHAVSVTLPFKFNIVVIYRPPGFLCDFFDEMDALLSCSPDDGTPLVVLGDFNIPSKKLRPPEFIDFFSTFDISLGQEPT